MNNYILYIKDITSKINLQIIIDSSFTLRDLKDEICKKLGNDMYPCLFKLVHKVAIVTGCRTGLGQGIVYGLAEAGAHIMNAESLIFYLLDRADTPDFKFLVQLLKE